jgi:hypothetical protein
LRLPVAGWSSSVARWAHNPEVAGSNPVPATKLKWPQRYDLWGHFHVVCERICEHWQLLIVTKRSRIILVVTNSVELWSTDEGCSVGPEGAAGATSTETWSRAEYAAVDALDRRSRVGRWKQIDLGRHIVDQ